MAENFKPHHSGPSGPRQILKSTILLAIYCGHPFSLMTKDATGAFGANLGSMYTKRLITLRKTKILQNRKKGSQAKNESFELAISKSQNCPS